MPSPALSPASSLALARARPASAAPEALGGGAVWRADELARNVGATRPTGHAALDAVLPGGGWPVGALVEVLQPQAGQGEWRLLLPALGASSAGALVLVNPPHRPFVPGLAAQRLDASRLLMLQGPTLARDAAARVWACEQALRCAGVSAVLAWLPQVRPEQLRRLQMAAQNFQQALFVMRPLAAQQEASPAVLRLLLESGEGARRADAAPAQAPRPAADHTAGAAGTARAAAGLARRQSPAVRAPPPGPGRGPACRRPACPAAGQRGAGGAGAHPRPCWRGPIRRSRCTGSPCCPCRTLKRRPPRARTKNFACGAGAPCSSRRAWPWPTARWCWRFPPASGCLAVAGRCSGSFLKKISLIPAWNGHKALHP
ncbi:translesion DNA synthesis-associated protein ImuA [Candidatus Skiveiella danica]|uniref:translesion DNA synthesis-associated protein ImuA n=1 Tax=Candidatus Skiveiella danica TaxID=3386177 RepID=UPI0039B90228